MNIPITKPVFDARDRESILEPLESGWVVQGPQVKRFETKFSQFSGAAFALATTSCTTALHLCMEGLKLGKGDRIIVPSFTFIATANAVEYTGAEVVFCDIKLDDFNIDPGLVESILEGDRERRIKAVVPVHLFGLCANMDEIMRISAKHGLQVVEDAACGFDAWIGEKHAGTFGAAGCFSFHPRKAITTGEGGMVTTNDPGLARTISSLRDHGASTSDLQRHLEKGGSLLPEYNVRGYNYRMTDFQGALGVTQLEKAATIMDARRKIAGKYNDALEEIEALKPPSVPEGYTHAYQSYVCLFTDGQDLAELTFDRIDGLNRKRNKMMSELERRGVATRQGTHAVHTLGYYREKYGLSPGDCLSSYAADRLSITLPLYAGMTESEFDYVIASIREVLGDTWEG